MAECWRFRSDKLYVLCLHHLIHFLALIKLLATVQIKITHPNLLSGSIRILPIDQWDFLRFTDSSAAASCDDTWHIYVLRNMLSYVFSAGHVMEYSDPLSLTEEPENFLQRCCLSRTAVPNMLSSADVLKEAQRLKLPPVRTDEVQQRKLTCFTSDVFRQNL